MDMRQPRVLGRCVDGGGKESRTVEHRQQLGVPVLEAIDHSIQTDDEFAKVLASLLRYNATDFRECSYRVEGSDQALDK